MRRNSDKAVRDAQRAWEATRSPVDLMSYIKALERAGAEAELLYKRKQDIVDKMLKIDHP